MSNLRNAPNRPSSVGRVPMMLPHRPKDRKAKKRNTREPRFENHSPSFAIPLHILRFESRPSSEGISPPTLLVVS